ncbi:MAG: phenylphosphate carboxylase subunit delta [Rhodospirillaceae bacterium]|mgnify:CR=1 FL=1|nr:phenylphosphate carboxylase subunit delta [Rhodospirillaceae bacterium]|tara:strand:+ start:2201 stop:2686 length:486 start_codon:yes stop_codon:yes gene_type:complete
MKNELWKKNIRLLALDVDGVLTDGSLYYGQNGELMKKFNVHDGAGIKAVCDAGIEVAIISSRETKIVTNRMNELGVKNILQGIEDKLSALNSLAKKMDIDLNAVAYVGDDIADLKVLEKVGLAITVKNGQNEAKQKAHYCTTANGGEGAVREICELLLMHR